MNSLIRSKAYQFMDSKVYVIIFSKVTTATSVNDVTTVNVMDMDLQKRIAMAHNMDTNVDDTINVLLGKRPNVWKDDLKDWRLEKLDEGNILFFKGKNYIPKDDELRKDILRMFHDHEMAGHPGELETYNSVAEYYWRPGLRSFVKNYVKGCGQWNLPTIQDRSKPFQSFLFTHSWSSNNSTICELLYGFHHRSTHF